jgi:hypothetical protein
VGAVGGALGDPALEQGDLGGLELADGVAGRHHLFLVLRGDAFEEFAFFRAARN